MEIREPSHVLLNPEGLVQKRYRFTTTGLSQLCSALAPGLAQCVGDICGLKKDGAGDDVHDVSKAIAILNTVISLRFQSRLRGHGLIIDRHSSRIEGLVGPRYEFFSNKALFERCQEFVQKLGQSVQFHSAVVAGRRLLLRYVDPRRIFSVQTPAGQREPFYRGWHFSNSEIGDCSVHAGLLIVRKWTGDSALLECGKIVHVRGGRFGPKCNRLLEDLQKKSRKELEEHDYEAHVESLMSQNLGLDTDAEIRTKQLDKLVVRLRRVLPRRTTRQVLHRTMLRGSYLADRLNVDEITQDVTAASVARVIAGRTVFDFYNSLVHVACSLQPEQQEAAEKLAYKILTERFKLV